MAGPSKRKPTGSAGRDLVDHAAARPLWRRRLARLGKPGGPVQFDHVSPAAQAFVAALVLRAAEGQSKPPRVWLLTPDLRAQENLASELLTWWGPVLFFPEVEQDRSIDGLPDPEVQAERLSILQRLAGGRENPAEVEVLVLNAASLEEEVPRPDLLEQQQVECRVGGKLDPAAFASLLEAAGYEREPQVADRGQFAIRGGIIDVFSWHTELPVRIELFGEEIESVRTFDSDSQLSVARISSTAILLNPGLAVPACRVSDCIGDGDWIVSVEVAECLRAGIRILSGATSTLPGVAENHDTACQDQPVGGFEAGDFVVQQARREEFTRQLAQWHRDGWRVEMFFNTEGEIERFRELVKVEGAHLACRIGALQHGFAIPSARLAVLCDAELFGRYQTTRARRLFGQDRRTKARLEPLDFSEVQPGDLVVHLEFGVAKYQGLISRTSHEGLSEDVLVLEFAEAAKLYVPLPQAYLVSRYVGVGKKSAELSRLGDGKWQKTRKTAEKSIFDYAAELLRIHAERQTGNGWAHQPDTKWQWEFENSFIYKETADQLRAVDEAKRDMESDRPMDRLICGDVGFGKTEVAIRAAFKAVMSGKQVAVLCPTTVLAQQHWRTFRERMSDYPVNVELLNRFRSPREIRQVLQGLAAGQVDICIGTHRLISKDVSYKDLGLVVVDEEQRFGVKHKERFKELFRLVDVLTLSATPIPRTLYLSLMGARDMSTIDTPPANRIPVETTIVAYDERVIRRAVERELKRGGQVFFLHNRVESIEKMAGKIRSLCPDARVVVGHGQMEEGLLEEVMQAFISGAADVLVSTTIIESGIDIPNANTILIDRADRFGLADLYQLRGRVGRAGHKAYAYLLLPAHLLTTTDARKRIDAIKQYSSLGSGFKIAMRDLEIRGAGNLLGTQQSGHAVAIGFELYCQVLKQAVASLKGQSNLQRLGVALDIDFLASTEAAWQQAPDSLPAFIGSDYIEDAPLRIAAYRQVAEITTQRELSDLAKNWRDRFGPPPPPVDNLLRTVDLKLAAHHNGIRSVQIKEGKLMLQRRGEYVQVQNRFPRLKPQATPRARLEEAIEWVRQL